MTSHPAVAAVDRFRTLNLLYDGRLTVLGTGDFGVLLAHGNLVFKEPADGRAALRAAIGHDAVVASESFALKAGKRAGDTSGCRRRTDPPTSVWPRCTTTTRRTAASW